MLSNLSIRIGLCVWCGVVCCGVCMVPPLHTMGCLNLSLPVAVVAIVTAVITVSAIVNKL